MSNLQPDKRKSPRPLKGWLSIVSGLLLFFSFAAVAIHFGIVPKSRYEVAFIPWALFFAPSYVLVVRGRQMLAVDAVTLLERDPRPPILYLRPFSEDGKAPLTEGLASLRTLRSRKRVRLGDSLNLLTYEERMARALSQVGPVVALGNPSEGLPELGAARMYVADSRWQDGVKELIGKAGLIVMQIGQSEGFLWELEQVIRTAKPEQLMLSLPFFEECGKKERQARYEDFRLKSLSVLPKPMPEFIGNAQFIYFSEDWTPHLLKPRKSAQLSLRASAEHPARGVQSLALKQLRSEFMLSTPYWFRAAARIIGVIVVLLLILNAVAMMLPEAKGSGP